MNFTNEWLSCSEDSKWRDRKQKTDYFDFSHWAFICHSCVCVVVVSTFSFWPFWLIHLLLAHLFLSSVFVIWLVGWFSLISSSSFHLCTILFQKQFHWNNEWSMCPVPVCEVQGPRGAWYSGHLAPCIMASALVCIARVQREGNSCSLTFDQEN